MANYSKDKKYHYTYKTTNLVNGRYYLGMHSTNRLDDGYLGSGKRLYYEISKYGRENFKVDVLEHFNSREKLIQAEKALITEQDLVNTNCLNLKPGGSGGLVDKAHINKLRIGASKYQKERWKDPEYRKKAIKTRQEGVKRAHKEGKYKYDTFKGKKHSANTIEKMKKAKIGHGRGSKNSQYGKPRSEETKNKIRKSLKTHHENKNNNTDSSV